MHNGGWDNLPPHLRITLARLTDNTGEAAMQSSSDFDAGPRPVLPQRKPERSVQVTLRSFFTAIAVAVHVRESLVK